MNNFQIDGEELNDCYKKIPVYFKENWDVILVGK